MEYETKGHFVVTYDMPDEDAIEMYGTNDPKIVSENLKRFWKVELFDNYPGMKNVTIDSVTAILPGTRGTLREALGDDLYETFEI